MNSLRESLERLRKTLEGGFQPDTAAPGFLGSTASTGHCAAVAVIVHALFGGVMISVLVEGHSHWLNRITNGGKSLDVDLTGDQFGRPPIQLEEAGQLYPDTRVRKAAELTKETLERARRLAERSGVVEAVHVIDTALRERV